MVAHFFAVIEDNIIGMALVFILLVMVLDPEKTIKRIHTGKTKLFLYAGIAFYYLLIIWKIIKQLVR